MNQEIVVKCEICEKPFILTEGNKSCNACPDCYEEARKNSGLGRWNWVVNK